MGNMLLSPTASLRRSEADTVGYQYSIRNDKLGSNTCISGEFGGDLSPTEWVRSACHPLAIGDKRKTTRAKSMFGGLLPVFGLNSPWYGWRNEEGRSWDLLASLQRQAFSLLLFVHGSIGTH